jgi:predicted nucleic acid-binding protein
MRSPSGASAFLLRAAREGQIVILANVALVLAYEALCRRAEHITASGLTAAETEIFLTAVVAIAEPVRSHFRWRPQLRDPDDELCLEAAVNGRAVTFNGRDFGDAPNRFGIEVLTPAQAAKRILS